MPFDYFKLTKYLFINKRLNNNSSAKKSLLNQLNSGYFKRVEEF
ncbi:hypothetical protein FVB9532_00433 [Mesonia oceanica]|uniref:Uncharacterized protein n=1 Tax=Mesonia oceanica TaxID=2687242 RepID=A0AC61Y3Y6_9FLAO|nr:hypothetical protein FVB9532_00433 [Mesonia oceanica]